MTNDARRPFRSSGIGRPTGFVAVAKFFADNSYPVIDPCTLIGRDPERYLLHSDGIHLSPEGHRLFGEAAVGMMVQLLTKNRQTTNGR